ncbi:MAG: polyisoprenoid-binding protein [Xanthomonadales bacterium PRO6]|nr:polyisoprenoid-binding protein [Xanthomonadales bacterium PRO6]
MMRGSDRVIQWRRVRAESRRSPAAGRCDYRRHMPISIRSTRALACALTLAVAGAAAAAPVEYRFDPVHSTLLFHADHMGFSTSVGRFARWHGGFTYDPDDPGANRADVRIEIASLDLGDAGWNRTMLSRKWFDAANFPEARFLGTRWEPLGEGRARLHGELTLKGRSAPLVLEVRVNRIGTHPYTLKATAGFSAQATLSRAALGLDALAGTLADAVELRIEVEGQWAQPRERRPGKR